MCNRGRKLLLFNDFLVAPTTIVGIVRGTCTQRSAPTTLSRPVCTVDSHFSFFLFFLLSWFICSWIRIQLPATNYITTIVIRERSCAVPLSLEIEISKNLFFFFLINRCQSPFNVILIIKNMKQLFARNKISWSSLNIHEDRSFYRRLTFNYNIMMFKNFFFVL